MPLINTISCFDPCRSPIRALTESESEPAPLARSDNHYGSREENLIQKTKETLNRMEVFLFNDRIITLALRAQRNPAWKDVDSKSRYLLDCIAVCRQPNAHVGDIWVFCS